MTGTAKAQRASTLAPVVVFAYMRPDHLRRTVESLLQNPEAAQTHVTFFCDAPKRDEHAAAVSQVRDYVASVTGFASVTSIYRTENLGLARSIVLGVTVTLQSHDRVIVLEDDLFLSPHFLRYMNDGLETYRDATAVASIHGYSYPTQTTLPETFFLKGADCWGWATWARAWAHFEPDGSTLLAEVQRRGLSREIDYDGNYPHIKILKRQIARKNDSWAIRWHVSCYLAGMVSLYPGRSLVVNAGHDDSGTNCRTGDAFETDLSPRAIRVEAADVRPSEEARRAVVEFFRRNKKSVPRKFLELLRRRIS